MILTDFFFEKYLREGYSAFRWQERSRAAELLLKPQSGLPHHYLTAALFTNIKAWLGYAMCDSTKMGCEV